MDEDGRSCWGRSGRSGLLERRRRKELRAILVSGGLWGMEVWVGRDLRVHFEVGYSCVSCMAWCGGEVKRVDSR